MIIPPWSTHRVHRIPRLWSNRELERLAPLFSGRVVNVSGWNDHDKVSRHYREYFSNASSYTITNFKAEARGLQGLENEIFLDLEQELPADLVRAFDVVFNHTTLEHVYEARTAFANLCRMSSDSVIIVLPFLQQYHAEYGDYWRFTPLAIKRLFEENGFHLVYQSFNSHRAASVYTFSIATRNPEKWKPHFPDWSFTVRDPGARGTEPYIGYHAFPNPLHHLYNLKRLGSALRFSRKRSAERAGESGKS